MFFVGQRSKLQSLRPRSLQFIDIDVWLNWPMSDPTATSLPVSSSSWNLKMLITHWLSHSLKQVRDLIAWQIFESREEIQCCKFLWRKSLATLMFTLNGKIWHKPKIPRGHIFWKQGLQWNKAPWWIQFYMGPHFFGTLMKNVCWSLIRLKNFAQFLQSASFPYIAISGSAISAIYRYWRSLGPVLSDLALTCSLCAIV